MDPRLAIRSQYRASLEMLEQAVVKCPDRMWNDAADRNRFWQVAFHAVFYTHLYLQDTIGGFVRWEKHRGRLQDLGGDNEGLDSYTKDEILTYIAFCRQVVDEKVPSLDLDATSGFHWLPFDKLELQFYNVRHLAQHTGELMERLGARASVDVAWVSKA